MTTGYKIKDVADRSGFTPAALRYYEEIGLLAQPTRNAAGYRLYDESVLDRLAFIGRAKQLGCTLQEISELTLAWSGGECGPIQDGLRTVVAEKLHDTERQIVELATLKGDLQLAAAQLELHRPQGPCNDRCGCVAAPEGDSKNDQQIITLGTKPAVVDDSVPITCTLESSAMGDRIAEWQALVDGAVLRGRIDEGVRLTFAPSPPLDEIMRLVTAEQDCCQFLDFAITVDTRGIALEVRSPTDALPLLHSLFGVEA